MATIFQTEEAAHYLANHGVIAYPTETVWGLGCLATSDKAIRKLLAIKNRSAEKGLISMGSDLSQFEALVDLQQLNKTQRAQLGALTKIPTTWLVPTFSQTSMLLKGNADTLAVRLTRHAPVQSLVERLGAPIISTSANLSGQATCQSIAEIQAQLGHCIDGILE